MNHNLTRTYEIITISLGIISALIVVIIGYLVHSTLGAISSFSTVLIAFTTLIVVLELDNRGKIVEAVSEKPKIKPISEQDFYDEFLKDLKGSKQKVRLTYFHNKSPLETEDDSKKDYYMNLSKIIKNKSDVKFYRIIRDIPQMSEWVKSIVSELKGSANFSLGCLPNTNQDRGSIGEIAVQCIDMNKVYLVAISSQDEHRDPRDLYIESEDFNKVWTAYFDRLWEGSVHLIDKGSINQEEVAKLKNIKVNVDGQ